MSETYVDPYPDTEIGDVRYAMALRVAGVFKVVAVLMLLGAVVGAIAGGVNLAQATDALGDKSYTSGSVVAYVAAELVSGTVVASFFAFFGYMLDILVGTFSEVCELRISIDAASDD